jgi:hypothetical protein
MDKKMIDILKGDLKRSWTMSMGRRGFPHSGRKRAFTSFK